MTSRSPVVHLEDAIGCQLMLAQFGSGDAPMVAHRYEILALHGRGASGVVCRARDLRLHRQVALKLYPPLGDPSLERETLREAQALARLEHANVVRVYDHDQGMVVAGAASLQCLFVSMEFIEGRNLRAWLVESRRSRKEILRVLVAAGDGLCAAHRAGLIHRDFKPENVMIDVHDRVRVVDFGLARGQEIVTSTAAVGMGAPPDVLSTRITRPGVTPGTPEYMAPEALYGQASASSDQYSFAAATWESLTGQLPGPSLESMSSGAAGTNLPAPVRATLERALAAEPGQRFGELSEVLDELRRFAKRGQRWATAGLVTAALVGLAGGAWVVRAQTLDEAAMASEASRSPETEELSSTPDCEHLAGAWYYDTIVVWASDSVRWYGATGHYQLDLDPLAGCSMNAQMQKIGDGPRHYASNLVRKGARGVRIQPGDHGDELSAQFQIASEKFGLLTYDFNFVFDGDQLSGDYEYRGGDGVVWKGYLQGGRRAPTETLQPELGRASCASQCRIRCFSQASRDECIQNRCTTEQVKVPDCGRPGADDAPLQLTRDLMESSAAQLRAERRDETARKRCSNAADAIEGRWQLSAASWTRTIEVKHSTSCELAIVDHSAKPTPERLRGLTTATGAWVILESKGDSPLWVLMGWDPALGVTAAGDTVVANRL